MFLSTASITALLLTLSGMEALVLTQEKSLSVNLGGNLKIPCVVSDSSQTWAISWYRQKVGGGPSFLLVDTTRAAGLPNRFTYSEPGSGYTEYLHINEITAEDEAVYICACVGGCGASAGHGTKFGQGTEVTIARPPSPPSLVLMAPAQAPLSGDKTTLVCLAQGFHPDGASLSWSDDGGSLTGAEVQKGESQRQADGTYTLSSLLSLPSTRWSSGQTFTCHLSHSALTNPLSRSVNNGQCSMFG
ncbi:immunoglobulin kappa light chain-like [Oncorhynchus masou masou]|uniref:immunoglobulin kappa light chain-like n=1 Tax=Oncorhynchus masou masou TaxID=90313 RepID=UPI0031836B6F